MPIGFNILLHIDIQIFLSETFVAKNLSWESSNAHLCLFTMWSPQRGRGSHKSLLAVPFPHVGSSGHVVPLEGRVHPHSSALQRQHNNF